MLESPGTGKRRYRNGQKVLFVLINFFCTNTRTVKIG